MRATERQHLTGASHAEIRPQRHDSPLTPPLSLSACVCRAGSFPARDRQMFHKALTEVRHRLPDEITFNYYTDRQSPWLLANLMPETTTVRAVRQTRWAKLLDRPAVKPLVARSGGMLVRSDVSQLAHADVYDLDRIAGKALCGALETLWQEVWQDYLVTFTTYGLGQGWQCEQISREGGNLVLQLGFPTDHAALMGRFLDPETRWKFEELNHPVRGEGRPTLAWARLDLDLDRGEALIEEVQSDWLRLVAYEVTSLRARSPQNRNLRAHQDYMRALFARYAKVWPKVVMLATLHVLCDHLGMRRVWMHRPEAGAWFKGMEQDDAPRSLYMDLPKSFCFEPVSEIPDMLRLGPWNRNQRLARQRMRPVKAMMQNGYPVFWRLDL